MKILYLYTMLFVTISFAKYFFQTPSYYKSSHAFENRRKNIQNPRHFGWGTIGTMRDWNCASSFFRVFECFSTKDIHGKWRKENENYLWKKVTKKTKTKTKSVQYSKNEKIYHIIPLMAYKNIEIIVIIHISRYT